MARFQVLESGENTPVPFLRGILTRSLQEAGLPFNDAYEIATAIRDELSQQNDVTEITTDALREKVIERLKSLHNTKVVRHYIAARRPYNPIIVREDNGAATTFSRANGNSITNRSFNETAQATVIGDICIHIDIDCF